MSWIDIAEGPIVGWRAQILRAHGPNATHGDLLAVLAKELAETKARLMILEPQVQRLCDETERCR